MTESASIIIYIFYNFVIMNSNTAALDTSSKPIAVLDCGSQLTDVLVQRVRALGFAVTEFGADNLPTPEDLKKNFGALIISGSGDSVDRDGAPTLDKAILNGGFPTLGICYGMQLIAYLAGGTIDTGKREE